MIPDSEVKFVRFPFFTINLTDNIQLEYFCVKLF